GFADAVVLELYGDFVLGGAGVGAIEQGAPAWRRHALLLLVGPAEPRDDLVVACADRDQGDEGLARGHAAVRRSGGRFEPAAGPPAPPDPPAHVGTQHEHARRSEEHTSELQSR